jgi:Cu2+-exporting ATPase
MANVSVVCLYHFIFLQGWKTFFEEPVMLIAFVLLGKNLEQRAKLKATSDMTGLLSILPSKARLMVDNDTEKSSLIEVPCDTLSVGDYVVVLPGVSTGCKACTNMGDSFFFLAAYGFHYSLIAY